MSVPGIVMYPRHEELALNYMKQLSEVLKNKTKQCFQKHYMDLKTVLMAEL